MCRAQPAWDKVFFVGQLLAAKVENSPRTDSCRVPSSGPVTFRRFCLCRFLSLHSIAFLRHGFSNKLLHRTSGFGYHRAVAHEQRISGSLHKP